MIYILIFALSTSYSSQSGAAAASVEFKSLKACQAAALEIRQQTRQSNEHILFMMCAAKE